MDPTLLMMGIGKRKPSSSFVDGSKSTSDRETIDTAADDHPGIQMHKQEPNLPNKNKFWG